MNSVVQYIIESAVSLGLFTILYLLLLQKETFFKMNRFFLLLALLFSLSLPLMHLRVYETRSIMLSEVVVTPSTNMLETVSVYGNNMSKDVALSVSTSFWLIVIYLSGVCFFFTRMVIRITQIIRLIRINKVQHEKDVKLVVLDDDIGPFSFLSWVFVGRNISRKKGWEKMLTHELEHIKQGHTFDILVMEIIAIFQWFNPFFWLMKRMIHENHEYIADQAVLRNEPDPAFYKEVLLTRFIGMEIRVANYFNYYSLIKKRIRMMSKIKSKRLAGLKVFAAVFVAIGLIILFACEQKKSVEIIQDEKTLNDTFTLMLDSTSVVSGDSLAIAKLIKMMDINKIKFISLKDGVYTITYGNTESTKAPIASKEEGGKVFQFVEDMPEFPGGPSALTKFLNSSITYPVVAQENGVKGKVFVGFIVDIDGSITNATITRGVDPSLDKEALRVILSMPKWKPGKQDGKPVRVSYTVPINFQLQ